MKYNVLIENVDKYNYENEHIYFKTITALEQVRKDLTKLDEAKHLIGILKPFLIKWGRMGRVVGRDGLDWEGLSERLRNLEIDFGNLREERFQTIDFRQEGILDSITSIYGKIDPLEYLGSPTTISKTLHVLNPEIFVMWDIKIRQRYSSRNRCIQPNADGYLEFLKETQKEIIGALNDNKMETGRELCEIEQEIRNRYENKTLAKIIDEYNYGLAHPF
jgi:hypothetical protein